jgi:hypothetical protein
VPAHQKEMDLNVYFADNDGWNLLVTPWPMLTNEGGLKELTSEQLAIPRYAEVQADAEHFYRTAGANAAVLLYRSDGHQPAMMGSLWLTGPLARQT